MDITNSSNTLLGQNSTCPSFSREVTAYSRLRA